jgi:hypothetical protein
MRAAKRTKPRPSNQLHRASINAAITTGHFPDQSAEFPASPPEWLAQMDKWQAAQQSAINTLASKLDSLLFNNHQSADLDTTALATQGRYDNRTTGLQRPHNGFNRDHSDRRHQSPYRERVPCACCRSTTHHVTDCWVLVPDLCRNPQQLATFADSLPPTLRAVLESNCQAKNINLPVLPRPTGMAIPRCTGRHHHRPTWRHHGLHGYIVFTFKSHCSFGSYTTQCCTSL